MRGTERKSTAGFTFIEVLVAMLIFVMAVLAAADIANGAVKATQDSRDVTLGTWLLQGKMVELETQLETEGIEKGCVKKDTGKFEAPFDRYSWQTECYEIDLKISETAAKLAASAAGEEEDEGQTSQESSIQKMVLGIASDYLTKAVREIHTEVYWNQRGAERVISLTTHVVNYNLPLQLGGALGGGQ